MTLRAANTGHERLFFFIVVISERLKRIRAKVNRSYEQNKDTSTRAVADGEKGNTTVDRATCLCICCSIVYGQVERTRDGGISNARGSFDGSGSVARGSFDGSVASDTTTNRAVACADCGKLRVGQREEQPEMIM